jgi:RNA recognition motif-containing protein
MKSQTRQHSRNRNRRGGQRRPGGSRPRGQTKKAAKTGLWARIVAFFSGEPKQKPSRAKSADKNGERRRQTRKPDIIEVTSPRLYVGNLSYDATESDLFDLFNGVGKVQNAEVVSNRYTQRSKGFAFVQMQTTDEAKRAVKELHDKEFLGRKLVVSGARSNGTADGDGD